MNFIAMRALIRNDLRIYLNDRRAVIIGVLVPILISAFFGYVFGGGGARSDSGTIALAIVNEDAAPLSDSIATALAHESLVAAQTVDRVKAESLVRSGKVKVAVVIPKGFADAALKAFFVANNKPTIELLVDPSDAMSSRVIEGLLTQHAMQQISKEAFSGAGGNKLIEDTLADLNQNGSNHNDAANVPARAELKTLLESVQKLNARNAKSDSALSTSAATQSPLQKGLSIPYATKSTSLVASDNTPYNGYAHSFAGMTVQFILLAGVDAGVLLLLLRERGTWQRLRAAPLSKAQLLFARATATTLISAFQFVMIYLAAIVIFNVRIQGSIVGFIALALSFCILNASFGLMLAAIGRSAPATRGLASMAALMLVMIGGAWVPAFVFPKWLQQASLIAPTRWAVDGLDAMTWRGLDFTAAIGPVAVLLATATLCMSIAIWRFRWEE